jgi:hypothetical protein
MKFTDKNDKYLLLGFIGLGVAKNQKYTIIDNLTFQEIFIYTLIFYGVILFIIILIKDIKKYTVLSLILFLIFDFFLVSKYFIQIEHYFTSKEIEISGKVTSLHEIQLKEQYQTGNKVYDKFTMQTEFEKLNGKQIYDTSHILYYYMKIDDEIKVKGRISKHAFKAEKFYFEDNDKQKYYGTLAK